MADLHYHLMQVQSLPLAAEVQRLQNALAGQTQLLIEKDQVIKALEERLNPGSVTTNMTAISVHNGTELLAAGSDRTLWKLQLPEMDALLARKERPQWCQISCVLNSNSIHGRKSGAGRSQLQRQRQEIAAPVISLASHDGALYALDSTSAVWRVLLPKGKQAVWELWEASSDSQDPAAAARSSAKAASSSGMGAGAGDGPQKLAICSCGGLLWCATAEDTLLKIDTREANATGTRVWTHVRDAIDVVSLTSTRNGMIIAATGDGLLWTWEPKTSRSTPWIRLGESVHTLYCGLAAAQGHLFGPTAGTVLVTKEPWDPVSHCPLPLTWQDVQLGLPPQWRAPSNRVQPRRTSKTAMLLGDVKDRPEVTSAKKSADAVTTGLKRPRISQKRDIRKQEAREKAAGSKAAGQKNINTTAPVQVKARGSKGELIAEDGTQYWEVEQILAKRKTRKGELEYKIKWKGTPEISWEPVENTRSCPVLVAAFERAEQIKQLAGGFKTQNSRGKSGPSNAAEMVVHIPNAKASSCSRARQSTKKQQGLKHQQKPAAKVAVRRIPGKQAPPTVPVRRIPGKQAPPTVPVRPIASKRARIDADTSTAIGKGGASATQGPRKRQRQETRSKLAVPSGGKSSTAVNAIRNASSSWKGGNTTSTKKASTGSKRGEGGGSGGIVKPLPLDASTTAAPKATPSTTRATPSVSQPVLPPGWSIAVSRTTGHRYYVETRTGRSQWTLPKLPASAMSEQSALGQTQAQSLAPASAVSIL
eukprot:SAG31_NODE_2959_length_4851_cov_5.415825_3_plen_760_part_00